VLCGPCLYELVLFCICVYVHMYVPVCCAYTCLDLCLFLVRWSVVCCQDGCLTAFAKGALPEEYLSHNFDEQCLGGQWAYLMSFLP